MGRLFVYLAIIATVIGVVILMPAGDPEQAKDAVRTVLPNLVPVGAGWIAGLCMGLALAWIGRFDWRSIPERLAIWAQLMRHRVWWMVCGGLFASVLLFF